MKQKTAKKTPYGKPRFEKKEKILVKKGKIKKK